MLDLRQFEVLSFDCYGTLIDWESGILLALRPLLESRAVEVRDELILALYAELEADEEKGPFRPYREVLRNVVRRLGERLGFKPSEQEQQALVVSLPHWPPFPDTVEALEGLRERYRLAILSNVDEDLFAGTARQLRVPFDWVVTAESVGSYKPSRKNFEAALERIGVPAERLLHVAQSLYHDIRPARELGLHSVWVNRPRGGEGAALTPAVQARPDLEVPDLRSLLQLVRQS